MSSINWIHHTMHAPDAILEELKAAIEPMLYKDDSAEIITDEDGTHLSVWSLNVDAVCDGIDSVSMRYPDAEIRSRYCASLPGAYHEILAKHIAGHTEIIEDVVHDILDEAGKEMGK